MKLKLSILLMTSIFMLSGCRFGGIKSANDRPMDGLIAKNDSMSTPPDLSSSKSGQKFEPYVHVYEVIGTNDNAEPIKIPIGEELLTRVNVALADDNGVEIELDTDIPKEGGEYTDETYSWIGLDVILSPDSQSSNRQWALLMNPKAEGVLCDYWGKNGGGKSSYAATDICSEIVALANKALSATKYGAITRFTLINEIRDIVKVEAYEKYDGTRLKGYVNEKTIDRLENLLTDSIDGSVGANAMSIPDEPYYTLKLTRTDDKEFIIQFALDEYIFSLNNWMVYMHKSGDPYYPMDALMEILGLDEWPFSISNK